MKFHFLFIIFFLLSPTLFLAQKDSLYKDEPIIDENIIEDFAQNNSSENFNFDAFFEELEYLQQHPLNINKASREQLEELQWLSEIQITDILNYRNKVGDLISIYELQSIRSLDIGTIRSILPFVKVSGDVDDFHIPFHRMLYQGDNEIRIRWNRFLEDQRGYTFPDEDTLSTKYLGKDYKLYVRFRHTYSNKLSYGITAEKDPGELFFSSRNKKGFDYYSAHFALKNYNKWLKDLVIGDYSVSMGQGLILYSGFGRGKGSDVMNIKRKARTLKKYSSVDENNFNRGIGATFQLNDKLQFTVLGSRTTRDANIADTILIGDRLFEINISSLQFSGFHRTQAEINDKDAIKIYTAGAVLKYKTDQWHIGLNGLYNKMSNTLTIKPKPYNQYFFNGNELLNLSLDYSYIYKNIHFFGEAAIGDNNSIATVNGLLLGLDRKANFALLHRHLPIDYHAINPNPFAESGSRAQNEDGIYMAVEIKPTNRWKFSAYYDIYQHPWLKSGIDGPSKGNELRSRLTYKIKRKLEINLEARTETKEINARQNVTDIEEQVEEPKIDQLVPARLTQYRLSISNKVTKALELRNRFALNYFNDGVNNVYNGYMLFQDIIFKPIAQPFSFSARFAIFNTDSYAVRFYNYENDVINSFIIPAYDGNGTRFYFNIRYKGIRNLSLEARYAQTYLRNRETIGSGLDEILGNTKTEVKLQMIYKF